MTNSLTIASATTQRTTMVSPQQSQSRQTLVGLARQFRSLTMAQKSQWQIAANQLNDSNNRTGVHKFKAANAFTFINSARVAAQMDISLVPILPMVGPPPLPEFLLTAGHSGGQFTLTLSASRDFPYQICVLAAPLAYAGRTNYAKSSFKPIGVIPGFSSPANLGAMFVAKYGVPEDGSAIALRFNAVSDCGIRGGDLVVTTVYLASSGAGSTSDEDVTLKAA